MCKKKLKEVAKLLKMMGCIRSAAESAQQARSDSPPHYQAGWETVFLFGNLTRPSLLMMSPKVPSTQLAISKL